MDAIDAQRSAWVQAAIQDVLRTHPDPREASINLPAACPFAKRLPKGRDHIAEAIKSGSIPCCRIQRPYWLDNTEPPLCRIEGEEVYRFLYMHAFGAHASIRIAKRRDEITVERRYYARMFNEPEFFAAMLTEADWMSLQNALTAADFWALPPVVRSQRMWLNGYNVIVEGRRGNEFKAPRLVMPDIDVLCRLVGVAFDLGGLAEVRLWRARR